MRFIFGNNVFASDKKREELVASIEAQLKKLKEDYIFALEFLEEYRYVPEFEETIKELKVEYKTAIDVLKAEVDGNIKMLRERVDKINKNDKWMNSKQSIDNMEGLNQTIGRLMALGEEIDKSKSLINESQTKETSNEAIGPVGPQ